MLLKVNDSKQNRKPKSMFEHVFILTLVSCYCHLIHVQPHQTKHQEDLILAVQNNPTI